MSLLREREAGSGQEEQHLQGGGGWVAALPRTSHFPLRLGFLTCTKGEHNPCLAPPKGLSVTWGWKSFAHCKVQRTHGGSGEWRQLSLRNENTVWAHRVREYPQIPNVCSFSLLPSASLASSALGSERFDPGVTEAWGEEEPPTPTLNLRLGHTSHTIGKTPLVASDPHRLASAFLEINKYTHDGGKGHGPWPPFP